MVVTGAADRAAQHRPYPGDKLAIPEWLHHIVIRPDLEQCDTVDLVAARRDHDDRHLGPLPQPPGHGLAVEIGKT